MQRLFIVCFATFMAVNLFAQNGTVSGTVKDKDSGEEIPMANIFVKDSEIGVGADYMGEYSLELPAGEYTLVCSAISYYDVELSVIIKEGEVSLLNFLIGEEEGGIAIREAVVGGSHKKGGDNEIDAMKLIDKGIVDGVSNETAKALGATNVANMTSKASGISVEGGKYVYVRGLSDRYSLTTLNGGQIPGLDPNRNSVQLDLFPSTLVQNVTIRKTFTPNLPGNFTGGLVDIQTKDFPDSLEYNVSFSLGFNTNATLNSEFLGYDRSSTDFLGFDNGGRALPESVVNNEVQNQNTGDLALLQEQTRGFSDTWIPNNQTALPNMRFGFSVGNKKELANGKVLGFNLATTYSQKNTFYSNGETGRYKLTGIANDNATLNRESRYTDSRGDQSVLWGALGNISLKFSEGNTVGLTLLRNQNGISSARAQEGTVPNIDPDFLSRQFSTRYIERNLNAAQFKGEHLLNDESGLRMNWIASAAFAQQDTPDLTVLEYLIKNPENNSGYDLYDADINVPSKFFRNMNEWNYDTKVNVIVPLKLVDDKESNLQFGVSNIYKTRVFEERLMEFYSEGISFNGNVNEFFNQENINTSIENYIYVEDRTDTKNSYEATQNVLAGYAMTDYRLGNTWRVVAGARVESAQIESISQKYYEVDTEEEKANFKSELNNVDVLPSLNITKELAEKTKLRMAFTRTLARPSFREVSAFASFDFENQLIKIGNPNLDRTLIDNFDVRYEFYPNTGEIFSISAFYKRFNNPIELVVNPEAANLELTWENQDLATLYGVEFDFRKKLNFLGDKFENWKIGTNVTLVESETQIDSDELAQIRETDPLHDNTRRMFGQSPFIINGVLSYKNIETGWSGSAGYNVSGPKLVLVVQGGTPNILDQPRHDITLSVTKSFSRKFKATLRGQNLLDAETRRSYTYNDTEYVFQSFRTGRTISASISYTF
ncbi:MAG: TonB-dependent receptor [Flavobacteriales bacterium]